MKKRDPITSGRDEVDALSARLAVLMHCRDDASEVWNSDVARARGELAKARELLHLARLRALNCRLERCRRPRWTVAPAQLGLFEARPVPPPPRVGGTPIGPGFSLTREALGLHLTNWPDETPGTVPPALAYAQMVEDRRRDLEDPSWGDDQGEPETLDVAELPDAAGPDELLADDGQAGPDGPDWAHPADVELVADGDQAEPDEPDWAHPADVELVADVPSNVVELPRRAQPQPQPPNAMGMLLTALGWQ